MKYTVKILLLLCTISFWFFSTISNAKADSTASLQTHPSLTHCYYKNTKNHNACYQIVTTADEDQVAHENTYITIDIHTDGKKKSSVRKLLTLDPKKGAKSYVFSIQDHESRASHQLIIKNDLFYVEIREDSNKPAHITSSSKKGHYVTITHEKPNGVNIVYGKFPTMVNQPMTNTAQSFTSPVLLTSDSDDGLLHGDICFYNGSATVATMGISNAPSGYMFNWSGSIPAAQWHRFNMDGSEPGVYWVRVEYYYYYVFDEGWKFVDDGKYNIGTTLMPGQTVNLRGTMFNAWTDVSNDC